METPDEPHWLDAEEQRTWLSLLKVLIRLPAALEAELQRDSGLRQFDYYVMAGLSELPGRTTRISQLAAMTEGSLARMSQVISRLESRGWVRREPDPADGRYTLAILTDEGQAKMTEAAPGHVQEVQRLVFDPLTKTQARQLGEIARRIMRTIDPADPCPSDRPFPPPRE